MWLIFASTPCEELDTTDTKNMNYSNAPIISPLSKPLVIELYNDTYFPEIDPSIIDNTTNKPSSIIDNTAFQSHPLPNPDATKFRSTTKMNCQLQILHRNHPSTLPTQRSILFDTIKTSINKLFFINYTPINTLGPR